MLLYNYLYPELANLVSCSRIAKHPSCKSSHSTHVERDCGRVVGSLFVGISRRKRQPTTQADTIFSLLCFQETLGMSLNLLVVADTLYSRVITTFLFAKVASAGMTAKHRYPIFPDSLWQPSHFITKMGIPYTLPKNYLLFIPMALTAFLGKEKVYTRQDMGIKKSSHESSNRTKEKCLTTLRKSI